MNDECMQCRERERERDGSAVFGVGKQGRSSGSGFFIVAFQPLSSFSLCFLSASYSLLSPFVDSPNLYRVPFLKYY